MKNEPRQKREFTDFSDYPQDGFGNLDADRDARKYPLDEEEGYFEDEEEIDIENDVEEY